jgi:hypothetical protein
MRLSLLAVLFAACSFTVEPLAPHEAPPVPPANPIAAPDLLPAPVGPASGPTDVPDLSSAADLGQVPSPSPSPTPTVTCNQSCNVMVPANKSEKIVCNDDCDVDCGPGATCAVTCVGDSKCSCRGDGCTLSGCIPLRCKGNTQVCNDKCGG